MIPHIFNRDFTERVQPKLDWRVNSMRWAAIGGCVEASITAFGQIGKLWEAIEWLRCPVEIDERGKIPWHGYIAEVRVRDTAIEVGATVDSLNNAVAVAYSYVRPGTQTVGQRRTTAYLIDAPSIVEYGRRDFLSSQGGMSPASALARRAAILASRNYPQGTVNPFGMAPRGTVRYSGAENSQSATLHLRGWFSTLDWRMASMASVIGPSYQTTNTTEQAVGSSSSNTKVVQQFTVGAQAINVLQLSINARKQAAPTDNLTLAVYALDGSGNPTGSALASVSIAAADITTSLAWRLGSVTEVELKTATQYGLQISRSGAADGTNYFVVNVNEAKGYSGGTFKIWGGSSWAARSPDADMPFRIYVDNNVETTQQIKDLASMYGAFITGVDVEATSGVILPSYRDGDTTVLSEIIALLASGGVGGRRLLANVEQARRLQIWEEPAPPSMANYYLEKDGRLVTTSGQVVMAWNPPVGQWVQLRDVIPATVDLSKMINPGLQFIEGATWSDGNGLQLQFRGQPSIDDMLKVMR